VKSIEEHRTMKKAKLIARIPAERFHSLDGSAAQVGDVVTLDQEFTFPAMVACIGKNGGGCRPPARRSSPAIPVEDRPSPRRSGRTRRRGTDI
jgi:hypothetical protein